MKDFPLTDSDMSEWYLLYLHKSPCKPATHPVKHVPLILEHCFTSRHCPHVSLQLAPNCPSPQACQWQKLNMFKVLDTNE